MEMYLRYVFNSLLQPEQFHLNIKMKKITPVIYALAFSFATHNAFAADTSLKFIKPLVLKYAESTGCADDTLDPKLVSKFSDKENGIEDAFIAMVSTDIGCMGGSGTSGFEIFLLKKAEGREGIDDPTFDYLKVTPELSAPVAGSNATTRLFTSLYQKNGQLFATGLEYGEDDANCCPSLRTIYKITLLKKTIAISKDDNRSLYTWNFVKVKNY